MMGVSRQQQWQSILQMTEQLQVLSAEDDWFALTELSAERQVRLDDFFSVEVTSNEAEDIAAGIQHIMQSDEQLMKSSLQQQQSLSGSIKKLATGKQVVKAYGDVESQ